jgi:hypothetical protein
VAPGRDGDKISEWPSAVTLIERDYRTGKTSVLPTSASSTPMRPSICVPTRRSVIRRPQHWTSCGRSALARTRVLAFPAHFFGIDLAVAGEAPVLGAHADEIAGELGVNEPALVVLRRSGALV